MKLKGKVAIVTGASYGIGRVYAHALAGEGAAVIAAARSVGTLLDGIATADSLAETVQTGAGLPGRIHARACDVTVERDVIRLVEEAVATFGSVDVLVNNAATYTHHDSFAIDQPTWDHHLNVNLRGAFFAIREAGKQMKRQRSGSIINITSAMAANTVKGHRGHDDMLLYGITKAGLNRMSHFISEDLKEFGVAVNALSPGPVDTATWNSVDPDAVAEFKDAGFVRPCTVEALGGPVVSLASHSAATLTGQALHTGEWGKSWH